MKFFQAAAIALLLCSCATSPKVLDVSPVKPADPEPPAEAMVLCAKPGQLEDASFGAVVRKLHEALGLLDECASKHKQLVEYEQRKK